MGITKSSMYRHQHQCISKTYICKQWTEVHRKYVVTVAFHLNCGARLLIFFNTDQYGHYKIHLQEYKGTQKSSLWMYCKTEKKEILTQRQTFHDQWCVNSYKWLTIIIIQNCTGNNLPLHRGRVTSVSMESQECHPQLRYTKNLQKWYHLLLGPGAGQQNGSSNLFSQTLLARASLREWC